MGTVSQFPLQTTALAIALQNIDFELYRTLSSTSLAIGTGSKVFTIDTDKSYVAGDFAVAMSAANPNNYMFGTVASYTGTTLTLTVTIIGGSGTFSDWIISKSGPPGAKGDTGTTGASYAATSTSSQTIGNTGTKTFTTQAGLAYTAGARVRATSGANWMEGIVSSYSGTTLAFTADKSSGSGTLATWTINLTGQPGADGAGTGDVVGPASATDNAAVRFDALTGKLVQDSVVIIDDTGNVSGVGTLASGKATATVNDATNSGVTYPQRVSHKTSGTPAIGIGAGVEFEVETATAENYEIAATIEAIATNITGAAENFDLVFKLMAAGAAVAEKLRIKSDGTAYLNAVAAAILLKANGGQTLTGGFSATSYSGGSQTGSNQTYTPAPANGNFQHVTLNGSSLTGTFTIGVPATTCSIALEVLNSGSGAVGATWTTSGFTKVTGDAYATTNGSKFLAFITKTNSYSHLHLQALQ